MKILFIEDDQPLGYATHEGLKEEYAVDWFKNAEDGQSALDVAEYDLIILDINLPGMSGIDWLEILRYKKNSIPVLLLTAQGAPAQRVQGLDAGADDYIVKPFDFDELLARIRALLRRRENYHDNVINYRDITIDLAGKTVSKNGNIIPLSGKELTILTILIEQQGRCLSKQQIEEKIYGWDDNIGSNTVEVHISAIRRKLGKNIIKTMRGIGYMIESSQ